MSSILPNSYQVFLAPNPDLVKDKFVYMGRRYFLLNDYALISEPSHVLPPEDRGFYLKLSKKEFKDTKERYEDNRIAWLRSTGYFSFPSVLDRPSFDFLVE